MVGQKEARSVSWLWLHQALGWKHVHFLSMGIGENGINGKLANIIHNALNEDNLHTIYLEEKRSDDEEEEEDMNSMMVNDALTVKSYLTLKSCEDDRSDATMTYSHYLQSCYEKHLDIISLIALYSGSLFGWKEPWIVQSPQKVLRNLKMYQKTYHYPSQSLSSDDNRMENKKYMQSHNKNNILSDSILVSTKHNGYWLGNLLSGQWYELGIETPCLENLRSAVSRGSMSVDLFPRSNRLYFAGGLVMGMPISTIAELDLDSMRLGPVDEMPIPRAYPSMVFFPDSLILIGGTNCWKDVYGVVEQYDFLKQRWNRLSRLRYPRYGSCAVTIQEKYIFITGGCDRFYPIMNAEIYDRKSKRWSTYPSMLKPAQKCHALKYKDDIFVVGAKDNTVQVFNVYEKKWRLAGSLNNADKTNKGTKLCTFDYRLCAMNRNDISKYEIYDAGSNRWYATDCRNHPIHAIYPKSFMHNTQIYDWFHLGRRYW
eukprot:65398_1